jgi:hypothetical protein
MVSYSDIARTGFWEPIATIAGTISSPRTSRSHRCIGPLHLVKNLRGNTLLRRDERVLGARDAPERDRPPLSFGETSLDVIEKVGFATRPVCRTCIEVSHPYGPAPLAGGPAHQKPYSAQLAGSVSECPARRFRRLGARSSRSSPPRRLAHRTWPPAAWPDGLVGPRCGNRRPYELVKLRRWEGAGGRCQLSLTTGTILQNTKTPLPVWFWAAYLMTTDKPGSGHYFCNAHLPFGVTKRRGGCCINSGALWPMGQASRCQAKSRWRTRGLEGPRPAGAEAVHSRAGRPRWSWWLWRSVAAAPDGDRASRLCWIGKPVVL